MLLSTSRECWQVVINCLQGRFEVLFHWMISHRRQANRFWDRLLKDVIQLFSDEAIKPISPITQLPITEVEEAFKRMTTSSFIGSIVLTVEQDPSTQQTVNVCVNLYLCHF